MSESYECPDCGNEFDTEPGLNRHKGIVHGTGKEAVECDTCGDTVYKYPANVKSFEKHYCSEECQNARIDVVCDYCGESIAITPYESETYDKHYCGVDCQRSDPQSVTSKIPLERLHNELLRIADELGRPPRCKDAAELSKYSVQTYYSRYETWDECLTDVGLDPVGKRPTGKQSPNYKERVALECEMCGSDYEETPSREKRSRFCSATCKGRWIVDNYHRKEKVKVSCDWCDGIEHVKPSRAKTFQFCSMECQAEWQSNTRVGPNHPDWEGGRVDYGPGWNPAKKEAVRERAGRECEHCGVSEEDHRHEFGRKLDVHHKTPARKFDDPYERNSMENLIALCIPCHHTAEKMAPLVPVCD